MKEYLRRDLNKTYLILECGTEEYEESYEVEMLMKNKLNCFLPLHVMRIDKELQFHYDISGKQTLKSSMEHQKMGHRMLRALLEQMVEMTENIREYLLEQGCVCLDPEHIFVREQKVYFVYCPWKREEVADAFRKFMEEILGNLNYQDREGTELAYRVYQHVCDGQSSIGELLRPEESETQTEESSPEEVFPVDALPEGPQYEAESNEKKDRHMGILRKILEFFLKKEEKEEESSEKYPDYWEEIDKMNIPEELFENSCHIAEERSFYGTSVQTAETVVLSNSTEEGSGQPGGVLDNEKEVLWKLRPMLPGYGEFVIREGSFLVGKKKEIVDGYIDRETISRIHSRLLLNDGRLYIGDANSTNGTFVNGKEVPPGVDLEIFPGDRVLFADVGYECYNSL